MDEFEREQARLDRIIGLLADQNGLLKKVLLRLEALDRRMDIAVRVGANLTAITDVNDVLEQIDRQLRATGPTEQARHCVVPLG